MSRRDGRVQDEETVRIILGLVADDELVEQARQAGHHATAEAAVPWALEE
jgi:hypothetical protein